MEATKEKKEKCHCHINDRMFFFGKTFSLK